MRVEGELPLFHKRPKLSIVAVALIPDTLVVVSMSVHPLRNAVESM